MLACFKNDFSPLYNIILGTKSSFPGHRILNKEISLLSRPQKRIRQPPIGQNIWPSLPRIPSLLYITFMIYNVQRVQALPVIHQPVIRVNPAPSPPSDSLPLTKFFFCRPLRKSCGGFGEHFGDQKMSQKSNMIFFNRNVIFKSFWEGVGKVLGRFEKGFGKVLERSGSLLGALRTSRNCFNSFFLFLMSLVAFSLFFCCFCLIIAYFACFLRLLLFVFAKLC